MLEAESRALFPVVLCQSTQQSQPFLGEALEGISRCILHSQDVVQIYTDAGFFESSCNCPYFPINAKASGGPRGVGDDGLFYGFQQLSSILALPKPRRVFPREDGLR